jgi:peptidoglycan/LPS O-acetylase OafA/YrhL
MSEYSIWPYFVGMAFLLLIVASPLFKAADVPPNPHGPRISTLDGLRGFLALGVFFHHAAIYHEYLLDDRWQLPPSQFYSLIGQVGVAIFFMITGYLFWSRLIADRGRPNWLQLYIGRVFRIGPLYLFAVGTALVIVFARLGLHLNVPALQFIKELVHWLSLGFLGLEDINGYPNAVRLLAGVTWSLHYEWVFYLSLPLLALAAGHAKLHLPFAAGGLAISLVYVAMHSGFADTSPRSVCVALFLVGMTCGSLARKGAAAKMADTLASVIVGMLICAVFIAFNSAYNVGVTLLLGGAFYLIASGCSFFGLLTSRPARRLGDVSYGIYLLQGLVLTVVFLNDRARDIALRSPLGHWSMVLLCAMLLVIIATATHVVIERTGIDIGKRVGKKVGKLTVLRRFGASST